MFSVEERKDHAYIIRTPEGAIMRCVDGEEWYHYSRSHAYATAHEANRQADIAAGRKPALPLETPINIPVVVAHDVIRTWGKQVDGTPHKRTISQGTHLTLEYIEAGPHKYRFCTSSNHGACEAFADGELTILGEEV